MNIILTSRRGPSFFEESGYDITKQKLSYLEGRSDLQLRVESFDATSVEGMSTLSQNINLPIGGCFVATLFMMDTLFMNQKPETFHAVSDLKLNVLKAIVSTFDVKKFDFLVSLSTMVTFVGNVGQSSYAA